MRLIDSDALQLRIDINGTNKFGVLDENIRDFIDAAPTVDAAPTIDAVVVTRCKDCKYLRVWNQKDLYAFCPKTNFVFLPFSADTRTHFCSYGEPKER